MNFTLPADIKAIFDDLLFRLRWECGFRDAVIAGGAVRDSLLGRPIKDIDVSCSVAAAEDRERLRAHFPNKSWLVCPEVCGYILRDEVAAVSDLGDFRGLPVQLIECDPFSREGAIQRMDIGLCQALYDGQLLYTDAFLVDALQQRMTVVRCEDEHQAKRTQKRIERLSLKYPEFAPVWPDETEA